MSKIIIFKDVNFHAKALTITDQDISNLSDNQWNDIVSSVIVIEGEWTLYEHSGYGGQRWHVSANGGPSGDGTYPQPADWNGQNDSISSVRQGKHT